MSYRLQDQTVTLLNAADMSMTETSSVFSLQLIDGFSVQHVWSAGSASRAGIVTISASPFRNGTFTPIDTYTIDASAGNRLVNVEIPSYPYLQIQYTPESNSTGTITSVITTYVLS